MPFIPITSNRTSLLDDEDLGMLGSPMESPSMQSPISKWRSGPETKSPETNTLLSTSPLSGFAASAGFAFAPRTVPIAMPGLSNSWDSVSTDASSSPQSLNAPHATNPRRMESFGDEDWDIQHRHAVAAARGLPLEVADSIQALTLNDDRNDEVDEEVDMDNGDEEVDMDDGDEEEVDVEDDFDALPLIPLMQTFTRARRSNIDIPVGPVTSSIFFESGSWDASFNGVFDLLSPLDEEMTVDVHLLR